MDVVQDRIHAWERAGLIDGATADRLRATEVARAASEEGPSGSADDAGDHAAAVGADRTRHLALSSVSGPGVAVGEMFGYLGVGFLLAAWTAFVGRLAGESGSKTTIGLGALAAAGVLTAIGFFLRTGDGRRRRAAGVAFLLATGYVAGAVAAFVSGFKLDGPVIAVVIAAATLGAAALFRIVHPALLTEVGLIASITGFGAAVLAWIQAIINPPPDFGLLGGTTPGDSSPVIVVIVTAVGWLVVALVLGLIGLAEEQSAPDEADDPDGSGAARRRATLTRAWAGVVGVLGLTTALTQRDYTSDDFGRVIPAWLAEVAILVFAIVLVERAFRRDSGAFLFAAAIGLIVSLTDFTNTYLTTSTEVGLLAEGAILLGVGFVANRLRRRLRDGRPPADPPAFVDPPAAVDPISAPGPAAVAAPPDHP